MKASLFYLPTIGSRAEIEQGMAGMNPQFYQRMLKELTASAGNHDVHVLWGRCYEGEGAPPFWPWIQILRRYLTSSTPETLRAEIGAGAAALAQVIPEIRQRLADLPSLPALEPAQERFRFFDSLTTFLKNAAQRRPLVLIFDDLQWADTPSLLLLQFVAREVPTAPPKSASTAPFQSTSATSVELRAPRAMRNANSRRRSLTAHAMTP